MQQNPYAYESTTDPVVPNGVVADPAYILSLEKHLCTRRQGEQRRSLRNHVHTRVRQQLLGLQSHVLHQGQQRRCLRSHS